ncbi:hypothetical protein PF005_g22135 [Phytophthora fragariae]|uniref:Uncharacterized protein n=1 Tax=Phytophthora fragariae TaxID=53985 RepID=A0A6A3Q9W9_9STRA|nr:hypothetical protein PF003_g30578 [Phytophthora fragariae]KAE8926908.1 hypothetical protein PF009_g22914 [Phytophthora fragariae]KAE9071283.1 hypothetical protein PF007_g26618 [Phytophthora fragariae]KAE9074416.1 hypothetical protein PF010_g24682 [Phytophthora fragariae]KAE9107330.1 hypothetical protein PF006_g21142 [Phytophthora fragariae]
MLLLLLAAAGGGGGGCAWRVATSWRRRRAEGDIRGVLKFDVELLAFGPKAKEM